MISSQSKISALVLMKKRAFPLESAPTSDEVYDPNLQIWISRKGDVPLVLLMKTEAVDCGRTPFGETLITETREGVDQSEGSTFSIPASPFGETIMTKTQEGTDQTETFELSRFGETSVTGTQEGTDQPDILGTLP